MSLHSDTLFWFLTNQSLVFLLNDAYLTEKQHITNVVFGLTRPGLKPTIFHTRGEHASHYATKAVCKLYVSLSKTVAEIMNNIFSQSGYRVTYLIDWFDSWWPIYCGLILIDIKSVRSISYAFCCIKSNGLLTNRLILLLSSQLTTSISWPCYCTVLFVILIVGWKQYDHNHNVIFNYSTN